MGRRRREERKVIRKNFKGSIISSDFSLRPFMAQEMKMWTGIFGDLLRIFRIRVLQPFFRMISIWPNLSNTITHERLNLQLHVAGEHWVFHANYPNQITNFHCTQHWPPHAYAHPHNVNFNFILFEKEKKATNFPFPLFSLVQLSAFLCFVKGGEACWLLFQPTNSKDLNWSSKRQIKESFSSLRL